MVHVGARGSIVVEAGGRHAIYVSQPNAVATIIEKAAGEVKTALALRQRHSQAERYCRSESKATGSGG